MKKKSFCRINSKHKLTEVIRTKRRKKRKKIVKITLIASISTVDGSSSGSESSAGWCITALQAELDNISVPY